MWAGAKNGSPTSSCSSSESAYPHEQFANICRNDSLVGHAVISAGAPSCATMRRPIIACDFAVVVTATFRLFYVLMIIEHGSRRFLHCNVTEYPTAEWTLQQLREAIPCGHSYRYLIHDRDNIYSKELDGSVTRLGINVIRTPYRSPQANSICERAIGSLRREFLDYVIPLNEAHLCKLIKE